MLRTFEYYRYGPPSTRFFGTLTAHWNMRRRLLYEIHMHQVKTEESDSDNEGSQAASDVDIDDHLSERSNDSESVQEASDMGLDSDNIDPESVQHQLHQQFYKEKDGTMWQKVSAPANVRTSGLFTQNLNSSQHVGKTQGLQPLIIKKILP
ncbi:hypothetical protein EVAR_73182_1 [Eumeta japonica]|uniref:Uncharacterized protein n=1 Tax=Eumeta variegata TaxID=151549 RepID=A0A4C1TBS8_EUMVA|nr:hypothetical protein EVAR_73182_1 [Eumeta japonica]